MPEVASELRKNRAMRVNDPPKGGYPGVIAHHKGVACGRPGAFLGICRATVPSVTDRIEALVFILWLYARKCQRFASAIATTQSGYL